MKKGLGLGIAINIVQYGGEVITYKFPVHTCVDNYQ